MSKKHSISICYSFMALVSATAQAQQSTDLPAILGDPQVTVDTYLPDFSYAGYEYGVGTPPETLGEVLEARDFGAVPDDDTDDSHALRAAIAAAAERNAHTGRLALVRAQHKLITAQHIDAEPVDVFQSVKQQADKIACIGERVGLVAHERDKLGFE